MEWMSSVDGRKLVKGVEGDSEILVDGERKIEIFLSLERSGTFC
jgi:hypothetical protein